jgi:hypothetical protein
MSEERTGQGEAQLSTLKQSQAIIASLSYDFKGYWAAFPVAFQSLSQQGV